MGADGQHAVELGGREGAVQEEATHHVREALPQQQWQRHELIVQHQDQVPRLVNVRHHLRHTTPTRVRGPVWLDEVLWLGEVRGVGYLEVALVGVVVGLVLLHEGLKQALVEVVAVDAVEQRPQHAVTELNIDTHHTASGPALVMH